MFGFADRRERGAKLGGALLLRQVAALDDGETGGVDVGVIDRVGRKTGERGIGLDCLADLLPDGVFADAEQNMHAVIGGISLLLREEVLEDVIGGFADNRVRRDQHRHAAEAVGPHLRTGERRDRGDVAERG